MLFVSLFLFRVIKRERLVEHLRKSISKIIAAWFGEKADVNDPKNMVFSFSRFESKRLKVSGTFVLVY